jgi:mannose-6-phosphate isomerase-like protein (cupin superfamily)
MPVRGAQKEANEMAAVEKKSLNQPEETQTPEKARVETVKVGGLKIQRITVEPGWQWSKHLKPVVGTESCEKDHLMYIISGKGRARMNDGREVSFGPGDVVAIPPGHDGWNAGTEPLVWIEIPH